MILILNLLIVSDMILGKIINFFGFLLYGELNKEIF